MKKILFICLFLSLIGKTYGQFTTEQDAVLKADLSRGNYLIMKKPFQIEATVWGSKYAPLAESKWLYAFNASLYNKSNFSSYLTWEGTDLSWIKPVELKSLPHSKFVEIDNINNFKIVNDFTVEELTSNYFDKMVRIQLADDDISYDMAEAKKDTVKSYFDSKRADPKFNNILLSIDLSGLNNLPFNENLVLINKLKPDLILFNQYPWGNSKPAHWPIVQLSAWQTYLSAYRKLALAGYDGTGAKPIPFGNFLQVSNENSVYLTNQSYGQMRYNAFASLAYGCKFLSSFQYNNLDNSPDVRLLLFDEKGLPTQEFMQQAEINRQVRNLGIALTQLQTKDIRLHPRRSYIELAPFTSTLSFYIEDMSHYKTALDPNNVNQKPFYDLCATFEKTWVERHDPYLKKIALLDCLGNDSQNGDLLVGFFNPVHKSLDGSGTTNEIYFMIVNGLYGERDNTVLAREKIKLEFDFGTNSNIKNLIRLNRFSGMLEKVPLTKVNTTENKYYLELFLDGGEGDLFKYDDGVPFVGVQKLSNKQ